MSFDDDVETHQDAINTKQVDWCETTREKYIYKVTNDVVENQMELDCEESDQELKEIEVANNLRPAYVVRMLEQIKTMAITSTDRTFIESYDYIYRKVQETSISERTQISIDKYFK